MNFNLDTPKGKFFKDMVDELVEFAKDDEELAEGIRWLDGQAFNKGISFYEMVFRTLYKHDISKKSKNWLESIALQKDQRGKQ